MNESEFHALADTTLSALCDTLEEADGQGTVELEYQAGVVTIQLPGGKQWLLSKHTPTRQIWLSSPISGGLHFIYADGQWSLPDGRMLTDVLSQELRSLGVEIAFA